MFTLNLPRDAISQFRAHIDRFKTRIGFKELEFEHFGWLSKQYNIFGDIFDEAVKLGLPAVQTQHPGLYYQQAAQYAILRRQSCKELCSNIKTYPTPDPLQGTNILEFYGQRPWRPGKLSAEPPNPQLEQNGIMALQFSEQHVNHSNAIITLYGLAITQYKAYRCPRTRRHLIVQMADEYFITKDYGKALTLLTHMLWDYRSEKWWNIISSILLKALKCAYLTANLQDYIILTMEALGGHISIDEEKKKKMYENLYNVLNRQLPEPESDLPPLCVQSAISQWQQILTSQSLQFSLEMGEMVSSIDCRARFVKTEYEADENVSVEIYLKSLCLFPMHFLRISVTINMAGLNSEYVVDSGNVNHIVLNSNEIKWFRVTFRPDPINVDKEIQINGIQLQIGNNANNCIINLKFSGQGNNLNKTFAELQHFRNNHRNMPDFDNITTQLTTNIVPRHSKLDLLFQHANPALLDEWYEINVNIKNNENRNIRDIRFEVSLVDDDGIDSTEFSLSTQFKLEKLPILVKFEKLIPSEEVTLKFFLRTHKVGERTLNCKASFILDGKQPIASIKTETVNISIVKPFEITTKYMSMLFESINKFYVGEEFVIMPVINCLSPWPIIIENSSLDFGFGIQNVDKSITSQLKGTTLKHKEKGSEIYLANTSKQSDKAVDIGQYSIKWKRLNGFSAKTEVPLQGFIVDWIPLDIKISLPEHGFVRTPLLVQYHFLNKSHQLIQLDLNMEGSEAFMFAGYKQIHILPGSERVVEYNLYPLIPGSVSLPKLLLSIPDSSTEGPALRQDHLVSLLERALPKHLYVMPQMKGKPKLDPIVISRMM
ncbi:hypothetical protein MML48_5g00002769 [Holotrichia oblita]|uniref:Uncharacterized protein n=1 Tax=Holotrichia oblita TaxID=644536 RepID=A0ACB9T485_HOLOL|nr:hypothetical protein MML48_5g00002769 [Holotrichia oblita]